MVRPDAADVGAGPLRMTIMVNRAAPTTPYPYSYGNHGREVRLPWNFNSTGINGLFNDRW
jgi:hypothetical protein